MIDVNIKTIIDIPKQFGVNQAVKVGFPAGNAKSHRKASSKGDFTVLDNAIAQHFGTRSKNGNTHIPPRPFLLMAMKKNEAKYIAMLKAFAPDVVLGKITTDQVMERLGNVAVSDVQQMIRDLDTPPNSPVTIKRKGSSNPLIDTGRLRSSTSYELAVR